MTTIEHQELKGMTVRIFIITIVSTVSMVACVLTTYFGLKADIRDVQTTTDANSRVNEVRLKVLESQVSILQQDVNKLKEEEKK